MGVVVLVRHGETEWSAAGRHTSVTEVELTERGVAQATALTVRLARYHFAAVLCSPRRRARHTAELAGLDVTVVDDDLAEWAYGEYEGITTAQIHAERPDWTLWTDGGPGGESPEQVGVRVDRVLARIRPWLDGGDVALVAHGHLLRVVGARWVDLPVAAGGLLAFDAGAISELGHEREQAVLNHWNLT
jgi:probable phosphoglycerate mutase